MVRLTLYTRPGCHLCDAMKGLVHEAAGERPVELREVDITGDADLERRFGERIPVLAHGGRVLAEVRLERATLREALRNVEGAGSATDDRE